MVSVCQAVKSTTSPTALHQTEVAAVERQQRVTQLSWEQHWQFGHGSCLKQTYQYHWYFLLHNRVIFQLMLDWNVFTDISRQVSWTWPQKVILDLAEAIGTTPQKGRRLTWEAGATAWEWWFSQPEISWILTSMDYKIYIMLNFFEPCTQTQIQNQRKIHFADSSDDGTGWTKLGCFVVQIWNYEYIYIYIHCVYSNMFHHVCIYIYTWKTCYILHFHHIPKWPFFSADAFGSPSEGSRDQPCWQSPFFLDG